MIRIIYIFLFFLSSCSTFFSPEQIYMISKDLIKPEKISVDYDFYKDKNFSFIKVKQGRNQAILSLAYIREDIYEWAGNDGVSIFTQNGKIIRTIGLPKNFKVNGLNEFNLENGVFKYSITLYNPDLQSTRVESFIKNAERYEELDYLGNKIKALLYQEDVYINELRQSYRNIYYIYDKRVVKSKQTLNPLGKEILIEFYYL